MKKIAIVFLILALALAFFSAKTYADSATGQVTITGIAPTMSGTTLWNEDGADAAITLETGGNVVVTANATVRDLDGGATIDSASAVLYHSTSSAGASDEESNHTTNSSCVVSGADTYNRTVTCTFTMGYMAKSGTWTVNITANTNDSAAVSGTDTNTVNTLLALEVIESAIDFGEMSPGTNSSTPSNITVQNLGNQVLGTNYTGDDFDCDVGTIDVGNVKYSTDPDDYDTMSHELSTSATQDADFSLASRTGGTNSTDSEFFTINVPSASEIAGTCDNTVTVDAVAAI